MKETCLYSFQDSYRREHDTQFGSFRADMAGITVVTVTRLNLDGDGKWAVSSVSLSLTTLLTYFTSVPHVTMLYLSHGQVNYDGSQNCSPGLVGSITLRGIFREQNGLWTVQSNQDPTPNMHQPQCWAKAENAFCSPACQTSHSSWVRVALVAVFGESSKGKADCTGLRLIFTEKLNP